MAKDEEDDLLPDKDAAKGFYAKYEPKEILGRWEEQAKTHETNNTALGGGGGPMPA